MRQGEAHQLARERSRRLDPDRALADEERLPAGDRPFHPGLVREGEAVRVLADDDVALLQPQDALRLDAERADAERLAGFGQQVPKRCAVGSRAVDLVAELAHEADAQHPDRDAGERAQAAGEVGEGGGGEVDVAVAAAPGPGGRAGRRR